MKTHEFEILRLGWLQIGSQISHLTGDLFVFTYSSNIVETVCVGWEDSVGEASTALQKMLARRGLSLEGLAFQAYIERRLATKKSLTRRIKAV